MLTNEQKRWADEQVKRGFRHDELRKLLLTYGYQPHEAEELLAYMTRQKPHSTTAVAAKKEDISMSALILIVVAAVLMTGSILLLPKLSATDARASDAPLAPRTQAAQTPPTTPAANQEAAEDLSPTRVIPANQTTSASSLNPDYCDYACFKNRFAACEKGNITMDTSKDTTIYSEILEPTETGCSVRTRVVRYSREDWVGKEMVCDYNNDEDLEKAAQGITRCKGELKVIILLNPIEAAKAMGR